MSDLVSLFLDDYPRRIDALNSALAARQIDGVRAVAHTIRGGASNLCALRVVEAARALEVASDGGDFDVVRSYVDRLVAELGLLSAALRDFEMAQLGNSGGSS